MDTRGTPDPQELRAAFQQQSRAGLARSRSSSARAARRVAMLVAAVLGLIAVGILVMRLAQGRPAGLWIAFCALGALMAVAAWTSAKRGRTRWAMPAMAVGYVLALLGDLPGNPG